MTLLIEAANTAIAIRDGMIVPAEGAFDRIVKLPGAEIRPGLINAHDHLHRNHYGRLGTPPYDNAYQWGVDIRTRDAYLIAQGRAQPRLQTLLRGAWKNLVGGVTHVVHHDVWEVFFEKNFPLHVVRLASRDSLGMSPDIALPPAGTPFALHVAEGVDAAAASEIGTLIAAGLLTRDLLAVHAVGPDADGVAALRASGCALVWCPTSNNFLFGRSAPPALLAEGMDVLLGTDSMLSGDGTLLDELHAARGKISDARLLDAVGPLAARRLGIQAPSLMPGAPADLAVFRRPVLEAKHDDVALVMTAGKLRVLDPELLDTVNPQGGQIIEFGGVRRWISGPY